MLRRLLHRVARAFVAVVLACSAVVSAQQLLDRVLARVDGNAITLTDLNAAVALGIVEPKGLQQLIDRQLVLTEVARFSPPEPDAALIEKEIAAMTARAGGTLNAVMEATGVDAARIREMARDTLRIQAYLNQRFGTTVQVSGDEALQYYKTHPEEFTRDGTVIPFAEVEPAARQRAATARRASTIAQWMADLRTRANVVIRN